MLREYLEIVRSFNRDVRLYLLSGALVGFASSSGIYNLLLNIYLLRLGYDIGFVGFVNATGAASYALLCLPAGAMGRRWGPRRMIVLGLALIAVGNSMLPFAEFMPREWQAHWLITARLPRAFGLHVDTDGTVRYVDDARRDCVGFLAYTLTLKWPTEDAAHRAVPR